MKYSKPDYFLLFFVICLCLLVFGASCWFLIKESNICAGKGGVLVRTVFGLKCLIAKDQGGIFN